MLTGFWHLMSFLGSAAFYVPVVLVLFWCAASRRAARGAVILLSGAYLVAVLKLVFHDPRPYWTDPAIEGEQPDSSFGMPSGHAHNAVVAWGFAAAQTRRRALWAGAAVIIVLVGLSRVYLGVHSIGQVLSGWAIGLGLLVAALVAEPFLVRWWTRLHLALQLAMALAVSLLLLAAAWAAIQPLEGWQWPNAWAQEIRESGGETGPVTLADPARAAGGVGEYGGAVRPRDARLVRRRRERPAGPGAPGRRPGRRRGGPDPRPPVRRLPPAPGFRRSGAPGPLGNGRGAGGVRPAPLGGPPHTRSHPAG